MLLKKTCDIHQHLNGRVERHGEEKVPAFDVRFRCLLTKNQLNKLTGDEHMWTRWYDESKADGDKPGLKHWSPYAWKAKFEESTLLVKVGLHDREINLGQVTLKRFVFTPLDGGQTQLEFSASALATTKNIDILLFMGYEQAALEVNFGQQVIESEQREMELESDDEDEAPGDKPLATGGDTDAHPTH